MKGKKSPSRFANKTEEVDRFMAELDHPFKAKVQAIREIIKGVHPEITEQIKWVAPSFAYKDYLVTFNLREQKRIHLVFHNPYIEQVPSDLLEGNYDQRRMAYFANMEDVKTKQAELESVIQQLIALMDRQQPD